MELEAEVAKLKEEQEELQKKQVVNIYTHLICFFPCTSRNQENNSFRVLLKCRQK